MIAVIDWAAILDWALYTDFGRTVLWSSAFIALAAIASGAITHAENS